MTRKRFPETALKRRLDDFSGDCAACGIAVGGAAGLDWDHTIPLELGGDDCLSNMQPLCKGCHKAKTAGDVRAIRRAQRLERRQQGIARTTQSIIPGSRVSPFKRRLDGTTVRRSDNG